MTKITLITMGNKMPNWVNDACKHYQQNLQPWAKTTIIEIPLLKRTSTTNFIRIQQQEDMLLLKAIPDGAYTIALDVTGKSLDSASMAKHFENFQQIYPNICFLIGGPEGFSDAVRNYVSECWSLSNLTLAHPLARIVLLEAIYRSYAIINGHPYHK